MIPGITASRRRGGGVPPLDTHSYWRIRFTGSQTGSYVALAEIQFRATPGGGNIATGGTASTNGHYIGAFEVENAFDGSPTTWYVSNIGLPKWVAYAFPAPVSVAQVAIQAVSSGYGTHDDDPKDFVVEWSDDYSTWTPAATVSGESGWAYSEWRTFSVP